MRYSYKITFHLVIPGRQNVEVTGGWDSDKVVTSLADFALRSELAENLNDSHLSGVLPEHITVVSCDLIKDRGVKSNIGDLYNYQLKDLP